MPLLSLNGLTLNYESYGQGQPLLLIHGLGSSTKDWENQIAFFSKQYQVICFDLRGHGKSAKPDEPYSIDLFTQDTAQFIQALALKSVNVVGHSLGGMISFQLALDYPDLVKSMTIINSAPAVSLSLKEQLMFMTRAPIVKLFGMEKLSYSLAKILFPKNEQLQLRETFIKRWCENDPKAYLNALLAFKRYNLIPRLSNLQCPTLVICADHDYTPISFKEYYTQLIPRAQMVIIEDSWHMSILDQPILVNQAIQHFLTNN